MSSVFFSADFGSKNRLFGFMSVLPRLLALTLLSAQAGVCGVLWGVVRLSHVGLGRLLEGFRL